MKLYQAKIILFIHDIVPLQFESNYYLMDKFVSICNKCDVLVVPSEKMYRCLVEHGVKNEKYVIQKMWDFKNDIRLHDPKFERKLYFTGEASRFPFVKNWHQETPLYVFGKEDITDSTNVNFGGWLNKYELLLQLSKGGFGLVWGNSENPEDERDYYKMNCSYKLASYLSAGIPVIIPDYLSNADFIKEKGIGFVVSSLEEASQVVQNCSEEEYNQMVSYYEKQLEEKNRIIDSLSIENKNLKNSIKFQGKQKQISDKDINKIRKLKNEGKSYSYISNETGWSKATISRVINNKKKIY